MLFKWRQNYLNTANSVLTNGILASRGFHMILQLLFAVGGQRHVRVADILPQLRALRQAVADQVDLKGAHTFLPSVFTNSEKSCKITVV